MNKFGHVSRCAKFLIKYNHIKTLQNLLNLFHHASSEITTLEELNSEKYLILEIL